MTRRSLIVISASPVRSRSGASRQYWRRVAWETPVIGPQRECDPVPQRTLPGALCQGHQQLMRVIELVAISSSRLSPLMLKAIAAQQQLMPHPQFLANATRAEHGS
jgi:hypothetical protein